MTPSPRHGRAPSRPSTSCFAAIKKRKTWMPETGAGMTSNTTRALQSSLRRHLDRIAVARALRDAIVDAAGLEQGVDQPQPDADDGHEEGEQHQIAAAALRVALFFLEPLIHR